MRIARAESGPAQHIRGVRGCPTPLRRAALLIPCHYSPDRLRGHVDHSDRPLSGSRTPLGVAVAAAEGAAEDARLLLETYVGVLLDGRPLFAAEQSVAM